MVRIDNIISFSVYVEYKRFGYFIHNVMLLVMCYRLVISTSHLNFKMNVGVFLAVNYVVVEILKSSFSF